MATRAPCSSFKVLSLFVISRQCFHPSICEEDLSFELSLPSPAELLCCGKKILNCVQASGRLLPLRRGERCRRGLSQHAEESSRADVVPADGVLRDPRALHSLRRREVRVVDGHRRQGLWLGRRAPRRHRYRGPSGRRDAVRRSRHGAGLRQPARCRPETSDAPLLGLS